MTKVISVKNLRLGDGVPAVIVPVMDHTAEGMIRSLKDLIAAGADLAELRWDHRPDVRDKAILLQDLAAIRKEIPDFPLLFTIRTAHEGGEVDLSVEEYTDLVRAAASSGCVDLVDVEIWIGKEAAEPLFSYIHEKGLVSVGSSHNFKGAPSEEGAVEILNTERAMGADIPKLAVMARDMSDVLHIMNASYRTSEDAGPVISIAMGKDGMLSRLAGELIGSCATFCSLKAASAPGQVDITKAREIMEALHSLNR